MGVIPCGADRDSIGCTTQGGLTPDPIGHVGVSTLAAVLPVTRCRNRDPGWMVGTTTLGTGSRFPRLSR